jgi:biopolymer transport protein ExbD
MIPALPITDPILQFTALVTLMVLTISPGPEYRLNSAPIAAGRLAPELHRIFAERPRKALFVDAAEELTYGLVIHAVDASRAAGVEVIGLYRPGN